VDLVVWGSGEERGSDGPHLLSRLRREHPSVDVLLLAKASAVEALTPGDVLAATVLVRPTSELVLRQAVERVLERRRLISENRRLSERLRTVERCSELAPCLDSGEIYPTVLDLLLELLSRHRGIAVFQRPAPLGQALAFRGFSEDESSRIHGVLSRTKAIDPLGFEGVDRVQAGPLHAALDEADVRTEAAVAVPIRGDANDDGGVVWIFDDARPFTEDDLDRAQLIARYAVAALRNAERYQNAKERAFIDDVTEIYNVRYLLSTTENEIQRADRYEKPLSVLFLDLDRFKLVNDRFGHLVGSQTLRNLSRLLLQCVRQVDTLARYGGDEFTILLVDTPHDTALQIAERIRRTVADTAFEAGDAGALQLTISIGVATFPEHGDGRDSLLDAADKAMYRAKSLGRNRVSSARDL
jgi:two-component system cell cycle response regulator